MKKQNLSLENVLETIDKTNIPELEDGKAKNIEEFYNKFIEPRLLKVDCVIKWHKLLLKYIEEDNAIFTLRAFGSYKSGTKNGEDLRRGFITFTNLGFKTVFIDNFFTSIFFAMAYRGYIPKYEEFKKMMISRKFPIGCRQTDEEKKYAAFIKVKNPKIQSKGYKIAHIYSAGENFNFSKKNLQSIGKFCDHFVTRGAYSDWKEENIDEYGKYHYRFREIEKKDETDVKKFLIAHFLRTVHPMNYFLCPKSKYRGKIYNTYHINGLEKHDIGEEENLISYVSKKFHEIYTKDGIDYFQEFLDLIYPNANNIDEDGTTEINIEYHRNPLNTKLSDKQEKFKKFLSSKPNKQLKETTINQYVLLWPNKIKQQCSINIYDITDIEQAKKIRAYFKKGGQYKDYNDKKGGHPSAVMSQYVKYLTNETV